MTDARFELDGRSHRERMLSGDQYIANDPDLTRESNRAALLTAQFNATAGDDYAERDRILRGFLGSIGEGTVIRPPFRCDYGYQVHIGARTFANWGLIALDVAKITIGDDVQIGPNVQLLTATHPVEPEPRRAKWEGSRPITIGNNVWLGGGVIVCPGVTIGDNTVVARARSSSATCQPMLSQSAIQPESFAKSDADAGPLGKQPNLARGKAD